MRRSAAPDPHHGRLFEAVPRDHDAGGMSNLLAAFIMIDGFGHGLSSSPHADVPTGLGRGR
jgi:hypothetical protein